MKLLAGLLLSSRGAACAQQIPQVAWPVEDPPVKAVGLARIQVCYFFLGHVDAGWRHQVHVDCFGSVPRRNEEEKATGYGTLKLLRECDVKEEMLRNWLLCNGQSCRDGEQCNRDGA